MNNSIVFLHIPKTAGTSVNESFRPLFPEKSFFDHCESRDTDFVSALKERERPFFASGHLKFPLIAPLLRNRNVFSFTCVRRPGEQLTSHFNWVMAYGAPEAEMRRKTIEPAIADLAEELWNTDLNDIDAMAPLMARPIALGLFDNAQTRYLRAVNHHKRVTSECVASAFGVFHAFDLVFTLDDYQEAMGFLAGRFGGLKDFGRKNPGKYRKRIDFKDEKIAAFYEPFIRHDRKLVNGYRWISRNAFFPHLLDN